MTDIKDPRLLWAKAGLFLFLGLLAGWLIWIKTSDVETILLLMIFAWAFCRTYYFAFYVIEKYADPNFRYSGLLSLLGYMKTKLLGRPYIGNAQTTQTTPIRPDSDSESATPSQ